MTTNRRPRNDTWASTEVPETVTVRVNGDKLQRRTWRDGSVEWWNGTEGRTATDQERRDGENRVANR